MGFWDFVAPDYPSFYAIMSKVVPDTYLGSFTVPKDLFIASAWAAPFSAQGLLARVYYESQHTIGNSQSQADALAKAIDQQGAAAAGTTTKGTWVLGSGGAMTLVIANTYRVAIRMAAGGKDITNVVGVRGSTSGQQAAAAAAVLSAWKTANGPLSLLSSLVAMQDVTAVDLSSTTGGISIVTDTTLGGVSTTNALATRAAAALVTFNSGTRSKSARGRLYFGPLMETNINADGASYAAVAACNTAFSNFRSVLATAGFPLVVISTKNASTTDVTSSAVQSTIATQRRRLRS